MAICEERKTAKGTVWRKASSATLCLCVSRDDGRLWVDPVSTCGSTTQDGMKLLLCSEVPQLLCLVSVFGCRWQGTAMCVIAT